MLFWSFVSPLQPFRHSRSNRHAHTGPGYQGGNISTLIARPRVRVAIAAAVAERLKGRNKRPEKHGNISTLTDQGATRDLAAAKAGLGSGKTLEAARA